MSELFCWVSGSLASSPCQRSEPPMWDLFASISTKSCRQTQELTKQVDIVYHYKPITLGYS